MLVHRRIEFAGLWELSVLLKNTKRYSWTRLEPGQLDPETNALTMRPSSWVLRPRTYLLFSGFTWMSKRNLLYATLVALKSRATVNPIKSGSYLIRMRFPVLCVGFIYFLWVLIGSLDCPWALWLATVLITSILRRSIENRPNSSALTIGFQKKLSWEDINETNNW